MADETYRLILDQGSSKATADQVTRSLQEQKTAARGVADTYEVLMGELGTYEVLERRVAVATDQVAASTQALATAAVAARGTKSATGTGLMAMSYAAQDFLSVVTTGGFGPALSAVANNVSMIGTSAGLGPGAAGGLMLLTAAMGAGIGMVQRWASATKDAKEEIKGMHENFTEAQKALQALKGAPSPGEEESAALLKEFLGQAPRAAQVEQALIRGTGREAALAALSPEQRQQAEEAAKLARRTPQAIEMLARAEEQAASLQGGPVVTRGEARRRLQEEQRQAEVSEHNLLLEGARKRAAEVIQQAQVAGSRGEAARAEIQSAGRGIPGLAATSEEAIESRKAIQRQNDMNLRLNEASAREYEARQAEEKIRGDIDRGARKRAKDEQDADAKRSVEAARHSYQREQVKDEANRRQFEALPATQFSRMVGAQQDAARRAEMAAMAGFANAVTGQVQASQERTTIWQRATQRLQQNNATGGAQ